VKRGTCGAPADSRDATARDLRLTDASTLLLLDSLGIGTLLTFDRRSFSRIGETIMGAGYADTLAEEEKVEMMKLQMAGAGPKSP
jgi:hypothetical protein